MNKFIKKTCVAIASLLLVMPLLASASTSYTVVRGDTLSRIAYKNQTTVSQLLASNPQIKNAHKIRSGTVITIPGNTVPVPKPATTTPAAPKPAATTTTTIPPASSAGETRFVAYITGYGWPDNTPKGSAEISDGVLHTLAGGIGTFADPITIAVGHSITGGKDILDYPKGTKFYLPNLQKYFIVEDTCGDGNSPQNGPCHTGYQGHPWLDIWVGGNASNQSATLACENAITDTHLIIKNPASTYKVVTGDVASTCQQFGDTVIMQ